MTDLLLTEKRREKRRIWLSCEDLPPTKGGCCSSCYADWLEGFSAGTEFYLEGKHIELVVEACCVHEEPASRGEWFAALRMHHRRMREL